MVRAADSCADTGGRELEVVTEYDFAMNFLKDTWWVATARRIHFMDTKFRPPWCLQRQGNRAKPLSRVVAAGSQVEVAATLGVKFCEDCQQTFYLANSE